MKTIRFLQVNAMSEATVKCAIIADDITGANDSGVQLVRQGLKTIVVMDAGQLMDVNDYDAVVIDTNSRACTSEEAYASVIRACEYVRHAEVLYKKMDSTFRGNVGREIDAVYEFFQPEVMIIAPGFPEHGRCIINGSLYLNGIALHETEFASDPKTPVKTSFLPEVLQEQTKRKTGLVTCDDMLKGHSHVVDLIKQYVATGTPYVIFDTAADRDLQLIMESVRQTGLSAVYCGSGGLARHLPIQHKMQELSVDAFVSGQHASLLIVVGSVSANSRKQLEVALSDSRFVGIELKSEALAADTITMQLEIDRARREAAESRKTGKHIILYSSAGAERLGSVQSAGQANGLSPVQMSTRIAAALGAIGASFIKAFHIRALVATGGDTARQVIMNLGAVAYELIDEVEPGVPLGRIRGETPIYAITKAGGFGTEQVFLHCLERITRGVYD